MLNDSHANILRLINQSGPLSRTELVSLLGVSKASMSTLAGDLIDRGMLTEGEVVHGLGRPSVRLTMAPASAFFVGVSLASNPFVVQVTDLNGEVVEATGIEASTTPGEIVAAIAAAVGRMFGEGGLDPAKTAGIGIAIPGIVDASAAICLRSTLLAYGDGRIMAVVPYRAEAVAMVAGSVSFGSM